MFNRNHLNWINVLIDFPNLRLKYRSRYGCWGERLVDIVFLNGKKFYFITQWYFFVNSKLNIRALYKKQSYDQIVLLQKCIGYFQWGIPVCARVDAGAKGGASVVAIIQSITRPVHCYICVLSRGRVSLCNPQYIKYKVMEEELN